MFNKVRHLFRKQSGDSQEIPRDTLVKKDAIFNEEAASSMANDAIIHEPNTDIKETNLENLPVASALRRLCKEYGEDFIKSPAIANALGDYNAFSNNRPYQAIFKVLLSDGIYLSLIESPSETVWENIVHQYSYQISSQYGFKTGLVSNLIREILIGIGRYTFSDIGIQLIENEYEHDTELDAQPKLPVSDNTSENYDFEQPYKSRTILPHTGIFPKSYLRLPDKSSLISVADRVLWVLNGFGIKPLNIDIVPGPRYSLYEIGIDPKKLSKLSRNEKDITIALGGRGCRIINPIPNKLAIGIEIPNPFDLEHLSLSDLLSSDEYKQSTAVLPITMGMDACGRVIVKDLADMNHLLICGGLQQGKTSLVNQLIASLLIKITSDDLKFVIANSNELELQDFMNLPQNYLANDGKKDCIISERPNLYEAFQCVTAEMQMRNGLFSIAGVKSIEEYNALFVSNRLNPQYGHHYLPHIICIVDEIQPFLDGKSWDDMLSPMLELTKNTGVHFIFTTRYTSVSTLTPLIRTYFPNRVSFYIGLPNESRLVIGNNDATNLLNLGDVLISVNGNIERCQTAKCNYEEFKPLLDFYESKMSSQSYILWKMKDWWEEQNESYNLPIIDKDPLFEDVARFVVSSSMASPSAIQRRYSIGYNRAGKIMDQLEAVGIVGPSMGGKPRTVLVDAIALESMLN